MVRLSGNGGVVELERAELGPPGTPPDGDLLVRVDVTVASFSAADQAWILGRDWADFLRQLTELERQRQGKAILQGASAEELALELFAADRAGHMALRGVVRRRTIDGFVLGLEYGFAFEPDLLPGLLDELRDLASPRP
ncbi:MAG: hypothetical protein KC731_21125 [Myxococcales bacterium]|nr:hypothetical protein [Myxococcales bacterium]